VCTWQGGGVEAQQTRKITQMQEVMHPQIACCCCSCCGLQMPLHISKCGLCAADLRPVT
jgi:hypothetical protein